MGSIVTVNSSPKGIVNRVRPDGNGSSEFAPNRPSGFTTLTDTTFPSALGTSEPWGYDYNVVAPAYDPDNRSFPAVAGPYLGTSLASLHAAGIINGGGIIAAPNTATVPRSRQTLYTSIVFKQSANFQQHYIACKFLYPRAYNVVEGSPSTQNYQMCFQKVGAETSGQFKWFLVTQPNGGGGATTYNDNLTPTTMNVDTWYRLELITTPNTAGVSNGSAQWWTSEWNGTSWNAPVYNASYTGVLFLGTDDAETWAIPRIDTYHGGNWTTPILPEDQYIYINRCHFAYGTS